MQNTVPLLFFWHGNTYANCYDGYGYQTVFIYAVWCYVCCTLFQLFHFHFTTYSISVSLFLLSTSRIYQILLMIMAFIDVPVCVCVAPIDETSSFTLCLACPIPCVCVSMCVSRMLDWKLKYTIFMTHLKLKWHNKSRNMRLAERRYRDIRFAFLCFDSKGNRYWMASN